MKPHRLKYPGNSTAIKIFVCVLFLLSCFSLGKSQVRPLHYYTVREGLISNYVMTICQDSKGYLWIGTTDGISIFDGTKFNNITTADGLSFSLVNDIIERKKNPCEMWTETNGGSDEGTFYLDNGKFVPFLIMNFLILL